MWLQKVDGNYYWYGVNRFLSNKLCKNLYIRPAKWWEIILNKWFKWQPRG